MHDIDPSVRTDLWTLPADTRARFFTTLGRALTRRCPYCGGGHIFANYFVLKDHCPTCGVRFAREEGYFLGAYAVNLVVSEFLGLGLAIWIVFKTDIQHQDLVVQMLIAVALVIAFPVFLFPYARGIWMALDLTFHPPRGVIERQLRGIIRGPDSSPPR
ncbi:MAG: DUF983 domain-containing protein [Thermomicrobiales bacterium]|nr:DUF983 domain-containing protein [Thermomicrobiales bacterium]